jgi:hypothetical protein
MDKSTISSICVALKADAIEKVSVIQTLWSGYGQIARYKVINGVVKSVVIKDIQPPAITNHPRGWNSNLSRERKLKSYQVEAAWYRNWSSLSNNSCKLPECHYILEGNRTVLVLEDLADSGYNSIKSEINIKQVKTCLSWLANFHAVYMYTETTDLWIVGTYWHLATRPEELERLTDELLKHSAEKINEKLNNCQFNTLVHGDAKLANFCFNELGDKVAAVDFQYVGEGCGMKDVSYFIGSCLPEEECEEMEEELLKYYFAELSEALNNKDVNIDVLEVEKEWRALYHLAWADFHRFLKGWSPDHWKINSYSERITKKVISEINS